MKIITTYQNPNFDALAGVFAASLLFPDHIIVLPKKIGHAQKNFLSIYFNSINFTYDDEIKVDNITDIVLICVKSINRVEFLSKILTNDKLFIVVIDKSPNIKCEFNANIFIEEEYGSVTTLLCKKLFENNITISPIYATLFALGIHNITGSFLYPNTTKDDIICFAELFKFGADLKTINLFLKEDLFSNIQKNVLNELINSKQIIDINGFKISFYFAENDKFIYKFDNIIQQIVDTQLFNIAIFIVRMGNNIHVFARNNIEHIDIGEIFNKLGGNGHKYAGYAIFHNESINSIFSKIQQVLKKKLKPYIVANDIMKPPLFIKFTTSVSEANKTLFNYYHTNALVINNENKIIGIIKKIDMEKAIHHGFSSSPITTFMYPEIIYVQKNEPIENLFEKISKSETKTIIVKDENKIIGFITADDLLNYIFTKNQPVKINKKLKIPNLLTNTQTLSENNFKNILKKYFDKQIFKFIVNVSKQAAKYKVFAYLVGGIVRDIILNKKRYDIDIVIENMSAIDFIEKFIPKELIINKHERFQTLTIKLENSLKIDFTTARTEFYKAPAMLPEIKQSNLYYDLFRRDFTINAMAISICQHNFGTLIDFFGGLNDITKKIIKPLHSLSFIEDPTRIFRALRFKARLNFKLPKYTINCIKEALKYDLSKKIEPIRIFNELELIFNEENVYKIIKDLNKFNLFEFISPDIIYTEQIDKTIKNVDKYIKKLKKELFKNHEFNITAIYFSILILNLSTSKATELLNKMCASKQIKDIVNEVLEFLFIIKNKFEQIIQYKKDNKIKPLIPDDYDIYQLFNNRSIEFIIIFLAAINNKIAYNSIKKYFLKISNVKPLINGNILKGMGIKPGPIYKNIFEEIIKLKLDSKLKTVEDEINYVKNNFLIS